jgi:16S rRNA (guanine527-N7)-methyltransferase
MFHVKHFPRRNPEIDEMIRKYAGLLCEWGAKMNLTRGDGIDLYRRHILDCAQILDFLPKNNLIVDVGSGAGLPGIVLAIYGLDNVLLCEKSFKKCVFLADARAALGLNFEIYNGNIYDLSNMHAANLEIAMVSRAFGKLEALLCLMLKIGAKSGIFHKGKSYRDELHEARKSFSFNYEINSSATHSDGVIIKIGEVRALR